MTGIQRGISPSSNWIFPSTFHQQQTPFHHQHCRLFNNVIRLFTTNSVDFSTTSNAFPTAIVGQRQQQIQLKESHKVVTRSFPLPGKGEGF